MNLSAFLVPADAIVACKVCRAAIGKPCRPVAKDKGALKPGYVHIGRRVARLLLTAKDPSKRDEFEAKAVALLRRA